MKKRYSIFIFICLICVIRNNISAQNRAIDSLKTILKSAKQTCPEPCVGDTNWVNTLSELAKALGKSKPDTALILGNQALTLAQKLNYKKGEAWAEFRIGLTYYFKQDLKEAMVNYNKALTLCEALLSSKNQLDIRSAKKLMGNTLGNIAIVYEAQADFPKALEYYLKGLNLSEEVGDKRGVGRILGNIAGVYDAQADYPKALKYYLKGLKIAEEGGDKLQVGATLGGIAAVYQAQADYPNALEYYLKGLKHLEEVGDKLQVGRALVNMASVYHLQANYPKAMEYYLKGLKIAEEVRDKQTVGRTLVNIAGVCQAQADSAVAKGNSAFAMADKYPRALEYYFKGLKIAEEVGDKLSVGRTLCRIGAIYLELKKYKEAELHLKNALSLAKSIGAEDEEKFIHECLTALYEKTNRPALALEHYKKHIALRDTIFSQENTKKIMRSEMDHEYEKKKAVADAEHKVQIENEKLVAAEKTKKQNIIIASVIGGLALVMIFAGFVFRSLRITGKQKEIIEHKNKETEEQKKEIEEKQKEILDSIRYAKRIQMAQIPSEKQVGKIFEKLRRP